MVFTVLPSSPITKLFPTFPTLLLSMILTPKWVSTNTHLFFTYLHSSSTYDHFSSCIRCWLKAKVVPELQFLTDPMLSMLSMLQCCAFSPFKIAFQYFILFYLFILFHMCNSRKPDCRSNSNLGVQSWQEFW